MRARKHLKKLIRIQPNNEERRRYLRLDLNENISGLPNKFIKDVIHKIDASFLSTYPHYEELQNKIASRSGLKKNNICLTNGSDAAIQYVFEALVCPGDKIILTDPCFAMYHVYAQIFQARKIVIPYNSNLEFPSEKFLNVMRRGIKLAVIVNPNNPAGSALSPEILKTIAEKARRNGIILLVDEAYFYFYPKSALSLLSRFDNIIVLRTFSKLCGMACARIGYAAASKNMIKSLEKVKPTYDVNAFGVLFATALIDKPWVLDKMIKEFKAGKKFLNNSLRQAGVDLIETKANFTLIRCSRNVSKIIKKLRDHKILVAGNFAHKALKDCIRVTIGAPRFMKRFVDVFMPIWNDVQ